MKPSQSKQIIVLIL